jgi:methionyl-tRNA synthetase
VQDQIIFTAAEALRICGILMLPFMPSKMAELLDDLGVEPARRDFKHATFRRDLTYGVPFRKLRRGEDESLFPPLITEE